MEEMRAAGGPDVNTSAKYFYLWSCILNHRRSTTARELSSLNIYSFLNVKSTISVETIQYETLSIVKRELFVGLKVYGFIFIVNIFHFNHKRIQLNFDRLFDFFDNKSI